MGLIIGNRALQGGPQAPYAQSPNDTIYQGTDQYLPIVFLDRTRTPVTPTSIKMELDDITNAQTMAGPSTLVSTGASASPFIYPAFSSGGNGAPWLLQIAAAVMTMTYPYEGSQICQLKLIWTGLDSVTGNAFTEVANYIFELVGSPTVSGTL